MSKATKTPESKINRFGKEYVYQGEFESTEARDKSRNIWKSIGHSTMLLEKKHLYVTRLKTRID